MRRAPAAAASSLDGLVMALQPVIWHAQRVDVVRIGSEGTSLVLSDPSLSAWSNEGFGSLTALLEGQGLQARGGVVTYAGIEGLDIFFADLASRWRGWDGQLVWMSIERELEVRAVRRASRNDLVVTLQSGSPGIWSAAVDISIEPGEETSRIAAELADFMAKTRAS
jgi:hypothetical protein